MTDVDVLHVVPLDPSGRMPIFVDRQIKQLQGAGFSMEVVGIRGADGLARPDMLARKSLDIRRRIRKANPHLVHAHSGSVLGLMATTAAPRTTPKIVTFRGSDLNPVITEGSFKRRLRLALSRTAARKADQVVCVSAQLAERVSDLATPVAVIHDGTDTNVFHHRDQAEVRREIGWPEDDRVIFFYQGGRPELKGRQLADDAIALVQTRGIQCRLHVLDGGVGREDVAALINASDCVLMLSPYEGSPNIVREAIACGTPVVSLDVGDVQRWLHDGNHSRITSGSGLAVADAIVEALERGRFVPERAEVFALSESASTADLVHVYRRLLSRH